MRRMYKDTLELTKFGIFSGISADVITRTGGDPAPIANIARFTPTLGIISGSSAVIRALKRLK